MKNRTRRIKNGEKNKKGKKILKGKLKEIKETNEGKRQQSEMNKRKRNGQSKTKRNKGKNEGLKN